jgi:hypothetical protein
MSAAVAQLSADLLPVNINALNGLNGRDDKTPSPQPDMKHQESIYPPPPPMAQHPPMDPEIVQEPNSSRDESEEVQANIEYTPRRGHAFKRSEDPPKNENGKMICKFAQNNLECENLTFDRKCEWR